LLQSRVRREEEAYRKSFDDFSYGGGREREGKDEREKDRKNIYVGGGYGVNRRCELLNTQEKGKILIVSFSFAYIGKIILSK